ncbi:MAG: hypothetical protein ACOC5M_03180 [Chloroflexota bacterium]
MSWLIVLIVVVLLVVVLWWWRKHKLPPLLDARVSTDGQRYSLECEPLQPELAPVEYVWLVLCTAARFVYITDERDPKHPGGRDDMIRHIQVLGEAVSNGADLEADVGPFPVQITEPISTPVKTIRARLYFRDLYARSVMTFLPATWHPYQFHGTLTTLAATAREKLTSEYLTAVLGAGLEWLAKSYRDGIHDRTSMQSLVVAPVAAFHEARHDARVIRIGAATRD